MSREEIKKALLTIKQECDHRYNCDSCIVKQLTGMECLDHEPYEWTFKEDKEIINCYRCGKEITDHTAYVIDIGVVRLAGGFGEITPEGTTENVLNNVQPKKYLCKKCKDEIKEFMIKKVKTNEV